MSPGGSTNHATGAGEGARFLSICSGIEAASVAWNPFGFSPAAFAEIEAFPSAVLAHHYPGVPNWGDITRFKDWPDADVDVLVGGTPCQSFSVAGLRRGLADPRGNLALVYLAIADRYRPRWLVWENVPGVLSSSGGRDFGAFLGGLGELGYGFAYRVLDAQYVRVDGFGRAVPQRRWRVFVVGHLGDWRRAAAVLFEREGLSGNPPPRREAGQGIAPTIASRPSGGGGLGTDFDCDGGLISRCLNAGGMGRQDYETETLIAAVSSGQGWWDKSDVGAAVRAENQTDCTLIAHALRAEGFDASEDGTGRGTPLVPVAASLTRGAESAGKGGYAGRRQEDDTNLVAHAFAQNQRGELTINDTAASLKVGGGKPGQGFPAVAFTFSEPSGGYTWERDVYPTLDAQTPNDTSNIQKGVRQGMAVRRLTPAECERLQGFPDGYTAVSYRGKPAADGPRYKALGNSMAVNVMRWIGWRISMAERLLNAREAA